MPLTFIGDQELTANVRQIVAQRERIGIQKRILAENVHASYIIDHILNDMVVSITCDVYAHDKIETEDVPVSWFDHLKHDLKMRFPRVAKRLTPRYRPIVKVTKTVYPHIPVRGNSIKLSEGDISPLTINPYI